MSKSGSSSARARAWVFILYPESAPADWQDALEQLCVPCAVSPLHDKDVNPTGETKKAHYHVLLTFAGMKSEQQVQRMIEPLNCTRPMICNSTRGTVRYFLHLDNPEKVQYKREDIQCFGGFDLGAALDMSVSEMDGVIDQLIDFIEDNNVYEFCDLVRLVRLSGNTAWREVITRKCTVFFSSYLRSRTYKYIRLKENAGDV